MLILKPALENFQHREAGCGENTALPKLIEYTA
jgi:hypothetical protein